MLEAFVDIWCVEPISRKRQCTWSATEGAGEDAGGCGVLERAEGGGRGHSSEESAPVAAMDVQHWRSERWRCARTTLRHVRNVKLVASCRRNLVKPAPNRPHHFHAQGVNGFPGPVDFCPLFSLF